jgi:hypothetical protein
MSTIDLLPQEIILHVVEYFDVPMLSLFSAVCKAWLEISNEWMWQRLYFNTFMRPAYFKVIIQKEAKKNDDRPAKTRKVEQVIPLTQDEIQQKLAKFLSQTNQPWKEIAKFRYYLKELNFSTVQDTLKMLLNNPTLITQGVNNIIVSQKEKRPVTVVEWQSLEYIIKLRSLIHQSRNELNTNDLVGTYLCNNFYYFGVYHQNATDGASYNVDIVTKFVIFHPETGLPTSFSSSFQCNGYRGEEEDQFELLYSKETFPLKASVLYRGVLTSVQSIRQQGAHIGGLARGNKHVRLSEHNAASVLFPVPVFEDPETQAKLVNEVPDMIRKIGTACDPSYMCYF